MRPLSAYLCVGACLSFVIILCDRGLAQTAPGTASIAPSDTGRESFWQKNVKFGGEIGAYGELYSISGRDRRRPASTGRLYFRPSITLFDAFSMSFDFLLSTEGSSARQNINQLGLNPSWSWGSAHIGDFTETYTPRTFNGVLVRGGGISINPGIFRFSAFGGVSKRAVPGGAEDGSYDRTIYGGRIGIGKEGGSFIDLTFLRVRDNPSSISNSLRVLVPNGSEMWTTGSTKTIQWNPGDVTGKVKIEISRDGGPYQVLLGLDSTANTGSAAWSVTGPLTSQAFIRITSVADTTIRDASDAPFTIDNVPRPDSTQVVAPSAAAPFAVTPQENLVTSLSWNLRLFENALTWKSEISGSVYTRDMRAAELHNADIPAFVTNLYKPRVSTRVDYAASTELNLNLSSFSAKAGYKYLGPGYTSLGVASLLTDQQEFSLGTSLRFTSWSLTLDGARQNDNLINQKLYTTTRNRASGSLNVRPVNVWSMTLLGSYLTMENDASNDTMRVAFSNLMLGTNQMVMFGPQAVVQTIALSYMYQTSGDDNPLRKSSSNSSNSANLSAIVSPGSTFGLTPSLGIVSSTFYAPDSAMVLHEKSTTTTTYALAAQYRALENKLVTSLSFGASAVESSKSYQSSLTSSYQFTTADVVSLSVRATNFRGASGPGGTYDEYVASLTVTHRF